MKKVVKMYVGHTPNKRKELEPKFLWDPLCTGIFGVVSLFLLLFCVALLILHIHSAVKMKGIKQCVTRLANSAILTVGLNYSHKLWISFSEIILKLRGSLQAPSINLKPLEYLSFSGLKSWNEHPKKDRSNSNHCIVSSFFSCKFRLCSAISFFAYFL